MNYVEVEKLEGENKYQAEGLGLQDAEKGIIFESFPPVLHLQLKRFEYDIQRDAMVKVSTVTLYEYAKLTVHLRSMIATNFLSKSTSKTISIRLFPRKMRTGYTNCTVFLYIQEICTAVTTLLSSNLIEILDGLNLMMTG